MLFACLLACYGGWLVGWLVGGGDPVVPGAQGAAMEIGFAAENEERSPI